MNVFQTFLTFVYSCHQLYVFLHPWRTIHGQQMTFVSEIIRPAVLLYRYNNNCYSPAEIRSTSRLLNNKRWTCNLINVQC